MKKKIQRSIVKMSFGVLLKGFYSVKIEGIENLPLDGRAILVANHASYLDPMMLYYFIKRRVLPLAKRPLFTNRWLGWVFRCTDCIPADGSYRGVLSALKKEEMVLIFPEGTRKVLQEAVPSSSHIGAAFFALKAGALVIPVGIKGTFEAWPRTRRFPRLFMRLKLNIGRPLAFARCDEKKIPRPLLEETLQRIMDAVGELAE